MKTDDIRRILEMAVNAPSGDNSQPWRFEISDDRISIYNVPEGDATLYNFRQRGSYLSHGALVENICILAAAVGYSASVTPFPGDREKTAEIALSRTEEDFSDLSRVVSDRTTNRKPYEPRALDAVHRDALTQEVARFAPICVRFVEGSESVGELSDTLSINERILMENRSLHDFLFDMIRWTEAEEQMRPGLYIRTMEFPLPVRLMLRFVIRHWHLTRLLNAFGLSHTIPRQSSAGYAASSAIGAIIMTGERNEDFFNAGRAFERLWLRATTLGLSLQPVTALPYLEQRLRSGQTETLSDAHKELVRIANRHIHELFAITANEHAAMIFRIGYDGRPTARSHKLPPRITSV